MSIATHHLRHLVALSAAAAAVLAGTTVAEASPGSTPQVTAKVDCLAYDAAGTRCEVAGVVYAITQIGGLTYIGGQFASVDGTPRANVAAIRSDGSLDATWNPSTDGIVYALAAASDGSKVFLGGEFTTVGGATHRPDRSGHPRQRLVGAGLDARPPTPTPFAPWLPTAGTGSTSAATSAALPARPCPAWRRSARRPASSTQRSRPTRMRRSARWR